MWNVRVSVRVGVRAGVRPMRMYPLCSCRAARPCPGRNVIVRPPCNYYPRAHPFLSLVRVL